MPSSLHSGIWDSDTLKFKLLSIYKGEVRKELQPCVKHNGCAVMASDCISGGVEDLIKIDGVPKIVKSHQSVSHHVIPSLKHLS